MNCNTVEIMSLNKCIDSCAAGPGAWTLKRAMSQLPLSLGTELLSIDPSIPQTDVTRETLSGSVDFSDRSLMMGTVCQNYSRWFPSPKVRIWRSRWVRRVRPLWRGTVMRGTVMKRRGSVRTHLELSELETAGNVSYWLIMDKRCERGKVITDIHARSPPSYNHSDTQLISTSQQRCRMWPTDSNIPQVSSPPAPLLAKAPTTAHVSIDVHLPPTARGSYSMPAYPLWLSSL